jgi:hypothetical protein
MGEMTEYQKAQWARLTALIEETKREAEASSRFKLGQLVRACRDLDFTFNPNATSPEELLVVTNPHDHNDPDQHFYSRVVGWDCLGRIEVAMSYHDNPHNCEWAWSEDTLQERPGPDWAEVSKFRVGMTVFYTYELTGFSGNTIGWETEARLIVPHIQKGDWIVEYPREDSGMWITRVLNERQMRTERAS